MADRKSALVTGASSGIGAACVRTLTRRGWYVAALARRAEALEALRDECGPSNVKVLVCDVTDAHAVNNAVGRLAVEIDGLDLLVNNAGLMRTGPLAGMDDETIRDQINVNLTGAIWVLRAALPIMRGRGSTVINVASVLGRVTRETTSVYAATKWALVGLTDCMRKECLESGVRITCLEPGLVETPLHVDFEQVRQRVGVDEALQPEDIADLMAYIAEAPPRVTISEVLIRATGQAV